MTASAQQYSAPAKINLSLRILDKRKDGYHNLSSYMHTLELHDTLDCSVLTDVPHTEIKLTCLTSLGEPADLPNDDHNLCVKAAQLFLQTFDLSWQVKLILHKFIPLGAGLGGGSSDAATVLNCLCEVLYHALQSLPATNSPNAPEQGNIYSPVLNTLSTEPTLLTIKNFVQTTIAPKLGADVPFCMSNTFALCEGIGEQLTALAPLPAYPVLLLKPAFSVNTAKAYADLDLLRENPLPTDKLNPLYTKLNTLAQNFQARHSQIKEIPANDFLPLIARQEPLILDLLTELYQSTGCIYCNMTGSGSTLFALYENSTQLQSATTQIADTTIFKKLACTAFPTRLVV